MAFRLEPLHHCGIFLYHVVLCPKKSFVHSSNKPISCCQYFSFRTLPCGSYICLLALGHPCVNWRHENLMRLFFRALRSFMKPGGLVKAPTKFLRRWTSGLLSTGVRTMIGDGVYSNHYNEWILPMKWWNDVLSNATGFLNETYRHVENARCDQTSMLKLCRYLLRSHFGATSRRKTGKPQEMWEDSCLGWMFELQFNGGLWSWDDVAGTSQFAGRYMHFHEHAETVPGSGFTRYWITEGFKRSMG